MVPMPMLYEPLTHHISSHPILLLNKIIIVINKMPVFSLLLLKLLLAHSLFVLFSFCRRFALIEC